MRALLEAGAEAAAVCDPAPEAAARAAADAPGCEVVPSLEDLLARGLDGIVIATPSAAHAEQAIRGLDAGAAVFCQAPLARTAAEARRVVDAAQEADRLLRVDLSCRHAAGVAELRRLVQEGALGRIYAVELAFHDAYGPDGAWLHGGGLPGGRLMDLGVHLVDLALWVLGFPEVKELSAPLGAAVQLELSDGTSVRLASRRPRVGRDCVIEAAFHGTKGGAALHDTGGSLQDLEVERFHGTRRERLAGPPDAWGGGAAVAWAEALAHGARFDPAVASMVDVHATLDRICSL
jgi:predicted dehydrogenase